jgi:hypothetical protein
MDRFINTTVQDDIITTTFLSKDDAEVNLLRIAMQSEIETSAIDIVIFHENTSARTDEIIALRLGQCVIDNEKFIDKSGADFKTRIDVVGPGEFNTDDIPAIPFAHKTPIAQLKHNQRILCDVIVRKGKGKQHIKWRPISTFGIKENKDGFELTIKMIGMMSAEHILERVVAKMRDAALKPHINLFFKQLVPANMKV